jgi:hypothetical protein
MRPELLSQLYLGGFLVGLLGTAAMLLFGLGHHGHIGHGGHAGHASPGGHLGRGGHLGHGGSSSQSGAASQGHATGHHGHGNDAHNGAGGSSLASLLGLLLPVTNLLSLLALCTAGGAAGWSALRLGTSPGGSIAWALGLGLLGAQSIAQFTRMLVRAEAGVVRPLDERGLVARVSATIAPDRVGEIILVRDGKRQALPARGEDAAVAIERGGEAVVMRVERGVAYVRAASDLFAKEGDRS